MHARKTLRSVVRMPIVLPGRTVARFPGYYPETEIYCDFDPDAFELPDEPTRDQVIAAVKQMWRPWSAYRFATNHDRAAMLAAIIGAVCRPGLNLAPGLCFDAPTPGSGKSIAATAIGSLILGRHCPVVVGARCGDEDEMRKLVVSATIAGMDVLILDNLHGHVSSGVLEGLITSGGLYGRVLGQSVNFEGEVRGTIMLTSNNASLSRDMARRFLQIRIDTGEERPQSLEYSFSPIERVLTERLAIASAVFITIQAFFNAGSPVTGRGDAGFPEWNRLVRQCVLWLSREGIAETAGLGTLGDPAQSIMVEAGRSDPESEGLSLLLNGLHQQFGSDIFMARDVVRWMGVGAGDAIQMIREAVEVLTPGKGDRISPASFANLLRYRVDRPCGGMVLRSVDAGKNTRGYLIASR